ncbi:MAG: NinB family protein [Alphaproteobacteria bacterium]|nr:MAG: NinB family protein [Alphaproteobacteria bacterium]
MTRALLILRSERDRQRAIDWARRAPLGTRIEFKSARRSLPQNDRMWAMLTDIATQKRYHGVKLSPNDWKLLFLDALKREVRTVPNLDGNGLVPLGRSSADLSKEEMSDLLELIAAWGAQNGVVFHDPALKEAI